MQQPPGYGGPPPGGYGPPPGPGGFGPPGGYGPPPGPGGYGPPPGPGGFGPPPGGFGPPPGGFGPPQQPQKKGLSGAAIALIVLGVLIVLGGGSCAACMCLGAAASSGMSGSGKGSGVSGPAITVQAGDLISAYKSNEISADNRYKGRLVNIAGGTVADVKKDLLDKPYIAIGTGAIFEFPRIQCFLRSDQVSKASTLSKGRKIAVRGTVRGLTGNVLIDDCTITSM